MQLVHLYLLESALRAPEKEAVVCDGASLSYAELTARIDALADLLIVEGLRKGDRVLVLLDDRIEYLVSALAVIRSGGIAVPVIASATPETVGAIARDCDPVLAVTSRGDLARRPLLRDRLSCRFLLIDEAAVSPVHRDAVSNPGHHLAPGDRTDRIAKLMGLGEEDGALILYTANVDGRLRGALFTHAGLVRGALASNAVTKIAPALRELVAHPLTQSMGFGRCRSILFAGGTIVLPGAEGPAAAARAAARGRVTGCSGDPGLLDAIGSDPAAGAAAREITFVETGAPSVSPPERKRLLELFPRAAIWLQYGLTEAPRSAWVELRADRKKSAALRPAPEAEILVADETGAPARRGTAGEILIQGPHVAARYWHGLPADPLAAAPWFRSGDIGILDKDGSLRVLGRKDEIINMSGVKISPLEVEEKISELYPGVELCVVGIPDPARLVGEIPVLCYIARDGRMIISSELSAALAQVMEKDKIPRIVYRMERFPTAERKLLRTELRHQLMGGAELKLQPAAQAAAK